MSWFSFACFRVRVSVCVATFLEVRELLTRLTIWSLCFGAILIIVISRFRFKAEFGI